jgi:hypothetical protein
MRVSYRARNLRQVMTIEAGLLAPGSSYWPRLPAIESQWHCGGRPRLQRRDRNGFAPFSLFFPAGHKPPEHLVSGAAI